MGLLDRWDRHNQSLLDYAAHQERQGPRSWSGRQLVLWFLVLFAGLLAVNVARDLWGGWVLVVVYAVLVPVIVVSWIRHRRRRLAWERERRAQRD